MSLKTAKFGVIGLAFLFFFYGCIGERQKHSSIEVDKPALNKKIHIDNDCVGDQIQSVKIYPVFKEYFISSEHYEGEYRYLGDMLGRDFKMSKGGKAFVNNGSKNEHYHIWEKNVLAPFDGIVKKIRINKEVNEPGKLGDKPASVIVFARADSVKVIFAHVRNIKVKKGQYVKAGETVAQVGNNGMSTGPHLHVGAWLGKRPLQIQIDLKAMGKLRKTSKK